MPPRINRGGLGGLAVPPQECSCIILVSYCIYDYRGWVGPSQIQLYRYRVFTDITYQVLYM